MVFADRTALQSSGDIYGRWETALSVYRERRFIYVRIELSATGNETACILEGVVSIHDEQKQTASRSGTATTAPRNIRSLAVSFGRFTRALQKVELMAKRERLNLKSGPGAKSIPHSCQDLE